MTDEALQQLWNTYQEAWSDIPPEQRDSLLRTTLAPDVAFTDPDNHGSGIDGMIANVANFQVHYPGCYFRTTLLRQQHSRLLCAWTMFDRDHAPMMNGNSYARFDEQQGRLTQLAGFWKL